MFVFRLIYEPYCIYVYSMFVFRLIYTKYCIFICACIQTYLWVITYKQ